MQGFRYFYDLEFEVIASRDSAEVSTRYLEELEVGKRQGFHPVFILWDPMLIEQLEVELGEPPVAEGADLRGEMAELTRSLRDSARGSVELESFFAERIRELGAPSLDRAADFDLDDKQELELLEFLFRAESFAQSPEDMIDHEVLLVRLPIERPEEAFAFFPIGGINRCPSSDLLIALAAFWRERHGAVPAVIASNAVEFYVQDPPFTVEATAALAQEQYLVCPDLVERICGNMENLTSNLIKNAQWFFWWD